jgi:fructokinase
MSEKLYGAIEAGGTKFVCVLARSVGEIVAQTRIATTTPVATLTATIEFFEASQRILGNVAAFGIGSFGPLDLRAKSPSWGCILDTPKQGWSGTDLVTPLRQRFGVPVAIDTDVNAAALAESRYGAGRDCGSLAYITVGTGIGGGLVVDGQSLRGMLHPEMGHIQVRRDPRDLEFAGTCPFHRGCLEGLASGPAIQARWGNSLDQLGQHHVAHEVIGNYLGQLAATIALMVSSERIVFGGGVMQNRDLLQHIRRSAGDMLNGYLPMQRDSSWLQRYIVAPELGEDSGRCGAIALAMSVETQALQH